MRDPRQLARSWYIGVNQLPWLPERLVRARDWKALRLGFERDARPGAFTPADIERYVEAWSQPGAITAMLNYYRTFTRQSPLSLGGRIRPVLAPTRVIWGECDRYLHPSVAEPPRDDVPNLEQVIRLPQASHWVQHDEPARVTQLLAEFFAGS
jgi:pimeloyl-ACP methyl ester carboxylesterase